MSRLHVFTSAAGNYLPKVRMLFSSLRRHRPEWSLHLVVADAPLDASAVSGVSADFVHNLQDLGIPDLPRWAFCHSLVELATAIKPFALKRILALQDCDAAIYLDPDIVVFSPLSEISDSLVNADIVLTPHQTVPETGIEGIVENEICTAQHGIYNLGFIGVAAREQGFAFAEWWADRVYRFGREDIANGIYVDQRWIDFVPAFFDRVKVLRSPGLNVAPWNLSSRRLSGGLDRGITVNGSPLGFYHFSQVDSAVHDAIIDAQPPAAEMVRWYRSETNSSEASARRWGMSCFDDSTPISAEQRLVYRLRHDLHRAYPDPFASGPHSYSGWWKAHASKEYPQLSAASSHAAALQDLRSRLTYRRVDKEFAEGDEVATP